jgi:hypothetical protein
MQRVARRLVAPGAVGASVLATDGGRGCDGAPRRRIRCDKRNPHQQTPVPPLPPSLPDKWPSFDGGPMLIEDIGVFPLDQVSEESMDSAENEDSATPYSVDEIKKILTAASFIALGTIPIAKMQGHLNLPNVKRISYSETVKAVGVRQVGVKSLQFASWPKVQIGIMNQLQSIGVPEDSQKPLSISIAYGIVSGAIPVQSFLYNMILNESKVHPPKTESLIKELEGYSKKAYGLSFFREAGAIGLGAGLTPHVKSAYASCTNQDVGSLSLVEKIFTSFAPGALCGLLTMPLHNLAFIIGDTPKKVSLNEAFQMFKSLHPGTTLEVVKNLFVHNAKFRIVQIGGICAVTSVTEFNALFGDPQPIDD